MKSNKEGNIGNTTATYKTTKIVVQIYFSTHYFHCKTFVRNWYGIWKKTQQTNPEIKIRLLCCDSDSQYPFGFCHRSGIDSFF